MFRLVRCVQPFSADADDRHSVVHKPIRGEKRRDVSTFCQLFVKFINYRCSVQTLAVRSTSANGFFLWEDLALESSIVIKFLSNAPQPFHSLRNTGKECHIQSSPKKHVQPWVHKSVNANMEKSTICALCDKTTQRFGLCGSIFFSSCSN